MSFLFFGYTAMLGAMAAASIPVIIHLLNKRKHRVVDWAAMQFLVQSLSSRHRRIKTEEMLLLALRTLLLVLLVAALARPLLPTALRSDPNAMSDVVVVIDGGRSMQGKTGDATRFDQARARAKELLDELPAGHSAGIIVAFDVPKVIQPPSADAAADRLKDDLDAVKPYPCNSDLRAAVDKGLELLAAGTHQVKKLIVITDGKRQGWSADRVDEWRRIESVVTELPGAVRGEFRSKVLLIDQAAQGEDPDRLAGLVVRRAEVDRLVGVNRRIKVRVDVENISPNDQSTDARDGKPAAKWFLELIVDGHTAAARQVVKLPLPEIKAPLRLKAPTVPANTDPRKILDERKTAVKANDAETLYLLAEDAAALGFSRFAQDRIAEILKVAPKHERALRLKAHLSGIRAGFAVTLTAAPFVTPGPHLITVRLAPPDPSIPTDQRHTRELPVTIAESLPVLVINGDPYDPRRHKRADEDETFFLKRALRPSDEERPTRAQAHEVLAPTVYSRAELDDEIRKTGSKDLGDLLRKRRFRAVVLANVEDLPPSEAEMLETFVADGGGLLILPGDRCKPAFYNALTWLPATFAERNNRPLPPQVAPPARDGRGKRFDLNSLAADDLLAVFTLLEGGAGLSEVDFAHWWKLIPRAGEAGVTVPLSLMGSDPALARREHRRGRVILAAFPADRDWSNFPDGDRGAAYVILLHEAIHHLAGSAAVDLRLKPNQPFVYPLPEGLEVSQASIRPPGDREAVSIVPENRDGRRVCVWADTLEPGLYRLDVSGRRIDPSTPDGSVPMSVVQEFVVDAGLETDDDPLAEDDRKLLASALAADVSDDSEKQVEALFTRDTTKTVDLMREGTGPLAIWHWVAWGTVAFLIFEVLLTRRIAKRIRGGGEAGVAFG